MAKLRDIADRAGTSIGTVSLALAIAHPTDRRLSLLAPFTIPGLTTVHMPVEEMAAEMVAVLLDPIRHKVRPPVHRLLPTRVVVREPCGAQEQEEGE